MRTALVIVAMTALLTACLPISAKPTTTPTHSANATPTTHETPTPSAAPIASIAPTPAAPVAPPAPVVTPEPAKPQADPSAELGCTHFRNVMSDVDKGLMTDAELRTRFKEIYSTARVSENAGIADGAQAMLAADTANDGTALQAAVLAFASACSAVGV